MDLKAFLQTIPALHGLGEQELTALDRALNINQYPDGHVFIEEGDTPDMVYLIGLGTPAQ